MMIMSMSWGSAWGLAWGLAIASFCLWLYWAGSVRPNRSSHTDRTASPDRTPDRTASPTTGSMTRTSDRP